MKKSIISYFVALLCVGTFGLCQEVELDREAAIKAFNQLTQNAQTGLKSSDAATKAASTGKFAAIAPVDVPETGGGQGVIAGNNAVRVWFELGDGRYVNPRTYRWAPGEVFYVHVQSAVPVYVALYQNFSHGIPSKRVYPTDRFPESHQMLMPGVNTKLPVAFQMDHNFSPEHMSMVVTRADWDGIRNDVPAAATTAVSAASTGTAYAVASTDGQTAVAAAGVLKGAEIKGEQALAKFAAVNSAGNDDTEYEGSDGVKCHVRYRVSYPRFIRPAYYVRYYNRRPTYVNVTNITNVNFINYRGCYHNIDDVAFYMFSDNGVGQWQVTLNKVGRAWRW